MLEKEYDILIVGAGPAGCACAHELSGKGLKVALVDKDSFPRDKICGDALSADVSNQLYRMNPGLGKDFEALSSKIVTKGIRFFAPNGTQLEFPFVSKTVGYVSKRLDFDNFLFNRITGLKDIDIQLQTPLIDIKDTGDHISVKSTHVTFKTKFIVGADGAHSIVNKKLNNGHLDKRHHYAGLRQYYKNVENFHPDNYIELHFCKDVLPGYFWIFPLPNNQANVGLGMISEEVSKRKIDLKTLMKSLIETNPDLKERFQNAESLESIKGHGLPIGSKRRQLSGNRYVLLGDAAGLIDPFTGEGIANAIRSGRLAAKHIETCFAANDFDARQNKKYDRIIWKKMGKELRISTSLQRLLKYPKLFNFVVKKANNNKSIQLLLSSMLDDIELKKLLIRPSFYLKLLFN